MVTPDALAAQAQAVAKVKAARLQQDRAIADLDAAIVAAYAAGAAVKDIAAAAGLSRQRIWQRVRKD